MCVCVCVCVFYLPLSEEQYDTTLIPRGPRSPEIFTVRVRLLQLEKNTMVPEVSGLKCFLPEK